MNALWNHFSISLRLNFRNMQALVFGYLVPIFFLGAFYSFYGGMFIDHMGGVLTISALGGACFGMPVTLVTERERGVWRRYRLAPIATIWFVISTILVRYFLVLTSALLQLALAMIFLKMKIPSHPFDLLIAFTFASFAFLGMGLVIAMLANTAGAVQALGQALFLPMIMIGGVGVPLNVLPRWARHISAFLPGRYAVEAMKSSIVAKGTGLSSEEFNLIALTVIGLSACLAAAKLFRWESEQRISRVAKLWVLVALVAWLAVGGALEYFYPGRV